MLKKLLVTTALAGALGAGSAHADNTALIMWTDGTDAVTATGTGSVDLGPQNLDGVTVTLTFGTRITSPANGLTEGNINIDNNTSVAQTLHVILGANDYLGANDEFKLSGTIFTSGGVADLAGSYFVDGADTLNGQSASVVGADIRNFDSATLTGPDSFSFNGFGSELVTGPYGLAEELTLTLQPGAGVAVQGIGMIAVPEMPQWAMFLAGFGLLGSLGWRRNCTRSTINHICQ